MTLCLGLVYVQIQRLCSDPSHVAALYKLTFYYYYATQN